MRIVFLIFALCLSPIWGTEKPDLEGYRAQVLALVNEAEESMEPIFRNISADAEKDLHEVYDLLREDIQSLKITSLEEAGPEINRLVENANGKLVALNNRRAFKALPPVPRNPRGSKRTLSRSDYSCTVEFLIDLREYGELLLEVMIHASRVKTVQEKEAKTKAVKNYIELCDDMISVYPPDGFCVIPSAPHFLRMKSLKEQCDLIRSPLF